ncbi:helix-turn-helix domain-containing protein [Streptomyces sp. NPDC048172]|uniref:helix-turn-helix domain-containing protein n=1 Tax=Streptomyces sp. NPDC048172 TaxID=3365505 RepID=UPI00371E13D1
MARGLAHFSPSELRAQRTNVPPRPDGASMTAEELARAVGATKAQILAYENGHRVPDPPRLRALARALKVHPLQLMNLDGRKTWTLADYRRAIGLRAQDVVDRLGVSPKNYRRFENEGIVPSRSPRFLDQVVQAVGIPRQIVETAIDQTPAVQRRQARAADLVAVMAKRYIPRRGPWRGPALDDPNLIELAAAYSRPVQRLRRVLTYELGELRLSQVRAQREQVIAEYDTDRHRQASARHAQDRWCEVLERDLAGIPRRLEQFHRTAQPSDVWQLLVDLYNVDASARSDVGTWAVTSLLCEDRTVLSPYLVDQRVIDDVRVCRLSAQGAGHLQTFAGLYAALYPGVRRPLRPRGRATTKARGAGPETFTLPDRAERLAAPHPVLETARITATAAKTPVSMDLSPSYTLTVGASSLSVTSVGTLFPVDAVGRGSTLEPG